MNSDLQHDPNIDETTRKRPAVLPSLPAPIARIKHTALLPDTQSTTPLLATKNRKVRRAQGWQIRSGSVAFLFFIFLNLVVQSKSYSLAVTNDGRWNFYRIRKCEAMGPIDALYVGSSHVFDGMEPGVVDNSVRQQFHTSITSCNLGMLGSTLEEDYFDLKRYIEDGYTPKLVVDDLWERNFNVNSVGGLVYFREPATITRLADLSDLPDIWWHYQFTPNGYVDAVDFVMQKIIPIYGLRNGIRTALCGNDQGAICATPPEVEDRNAHAYRITDRQGWSDTYQPQDHMAAYDPRKLPPVLYNGFHLDVQNFVIGGPEPPYLVKIIQLTQSHHIKLVLTSSPVDPIFFHYFDNPRVWPMILNYYQRVAATYGVPFYDASTLPGLTYLDFVDPQHLNDVGARIYSAWLGQHIVGPLVTEQSTPSPLPVPADN